MELEWLATDVSLPDNATYDVDIFDGETDDSPLVVDTRPLFAAVAADRRHGRPTAEIARRFHATLAAILVQVCRRLRQRSGLETVVLCGGVFQNVLLTNLAISDLEHEGFRVFRHRQVPPGDGGLSLGQLAVAAASCTTVAPAVQTSHAALSNLFIRRLLMCLAIPGKVVETYREHDVRMGKVDFGGISKRFAWSTFPRRTSMTTFWFMSDSPCRESTRPRQCVCSSFSSTMDQLDELAGRDRERPGRDPGQATIDATQPRACRAPVGSHGGSVS